MNEERASEGSPRRSGGPDGGASRREGTRRGGRRGAAAEEGLDPGELAQALQRSVAAIGTAGPPRAGLTRIRRRAKARQRRRTVLAGSAGVVFMVMAVSVLTGNSFDIVPVLTGVVGLGGDGGDGAPGPTSTQTAPADSVDQVRTVRPTAGRTGPAIGPGPVSATPSALAATGVGVCGAADLTTVASVDSVIGGVSYGHVEGVAARTCAVVGPPVLRVQNATADAAGSVVILQHTASDGSRLPQVSTWGTVLVLRAGQGYDFQFAWAPDACPSATGSAAPAGSGSTTGGGGSGGAGTAPGTSASAGTSAGAPASSGYQLSYLVTATSSTSPLTLQAQCGATVYVTDVYPRGRYPLPQPDTAAPTPQPPSTSAAPPAPATTPAPSSSPPAAPSSPPVSSSTGTDSGAGSGASPGAPVASPAIGTSVADTSTGQAATP